MAQQTLKNIFSDYQFNKPHIFQNKDYLTDRYTPNNIPHREDQISRIAKILAPAARGDKVSNIFIYGSTGTGKSLTTHHIAAEMMAATETVEILSLNCKMKRVSDTEYRLLAELSRLLGKTVPYTGLPTDGVYKIFYGALEARQKTVILILDEIDALVKKIGGDILYNLTRINQELRQTTLSLIGISNDTSFTDDLDPRVKSSLSEEEVIFPPYNATQLKDILSHRAASAFTSTSLTPGVIQKCAALAAQEHGDARRALDLLRIAGEIAERDGAPQVMIAHVDAAEERLDVDRTTEIIRTQPTQSKAVLAAIIALSEGSGRHIQTGDIFSVYEERCATTGLKALTQRRVSDLIGELDMLGIINSRVISKGRYGRTREIRLQLSPSVVEKTRRILADAHLL